MNQAKFCFRGFTLVELIAVICIISLLASGSMWLLTASLKRAEQQQAAMHLVELHRSMIAHNRTGRSTLNFDLERGEVNPVVSVGGSSEGRSGEGRFAVDKIVSIGKVTIDLQKIMLEGAVLEGGQVEIDYNNGGSQSYAVLIRLGTKAGKWMVVCGPSGRIELYDDAPEREAALVRWFSQWANTD